MVRGTFHQQLWNGEGLHPTPLLSLKSSFSRVGWTGAKKGVPGAIGVLELASWWKMPWSRSAVLMLKL